MVWNSKWLNVEKEGSTLVLEGCCPAEFSSNHEKNPHLSVAL